MCWEAATGKEMWKKRLGGNYSASPVLVGDLMFATSESGETHVLKISPQGLKKSPRTSWAMKSLRPPPFHAANLHALRRARWCETH